jgi:D-alanyl-lipoteichoic acid acyltransferase DltB (MBOAT superfamily)
MVFNSIWYALFLLLTCILIFKVPQRLKIVTLFILNVFFFLTNSIVSVVILFFVLTFSYVYGIILEKKKEKIFLVIGLMFLFLPLILFKYLNLLIITLGFCENNLFNILPIGISFYTFSAAGYLIDVYRDKYKSEKNFLILSTFISLFSNLKYFTIYINKIKLGVIDGKGN